MVFDHLKKALRGWEKESNPPPAPPPPPAIRRVPMPEPRPQEAPARERELVAGGIVRWKPVDRKAARMLAKSPWWAMPLPGESTVNEKPMQKAEEQTPTTTPRRKPMTPKMFIDEGDMRKGLADANSAMQKSLPSGTDSCVSDVGLVIKMINGQPMVPVDSVAAVLMRKVKELIPEADKTVQEAKTARLVIETLLKGIHGDTEDFRARSKIFLDDIRGVRFAMVSETAAMTAPLKDLRQFFLGKDYADEIARLREFVDLCERLQKLKASGFLDAIADTLLKLA